ncbi:hypothetical protein B4113_2691 [Geobacillus sp. B4113_201601]|nr:hypothetical protein B4113_2691 [Geobacillus sp. B4113_201601]
MLVYFSLLSWQWTTFRSRLCDWASYFLSVLLFSLLFYSLWNGRKPLFQFI